MQITYFMYIQVTMTSHDAHDVNQITEDPSFMVLAQGLQGIDVEIDVLDFTDATEGRSGVLSNESWMRRSSIDRIV